MKTITIPCPSEIRAAVLAEIECNDLFVEFQSLHAGVDNWRLCAWFEGARRVTAEGETHKEAIANLKANITTYDPAEHLKAEAAKLGMKLVPANQP